MDRPSRCRHSSELAADGDRRGRTRTLNTERRRTACDSKGSGHRLAVYARGDEVARERIAVSPAPVVSIACTLSASALCSPVPSTWRTPPSPNVRTMTARGCRARNTLRMPSGDDSPESLSPSARFRTKVSTRSRGARSIASFSGEGLRITCSPRAADRSMISWSRFVSFWTSTAASPESEANAASMWSVVRLWFAPPWMRMQFSPAGSTWMTACPVGASTARTCSTSTPSRVSSSRSTRPSAPTQPAWATRAPARARAID